MAYLCGLDLGQAQDYSALVIVEAHETPAVYDLRELRRFALGTPYPAIVTAVQSLLATAPLTRQCQLVVDATGCGRPVVDMFRQVPPGGLPTGPVIAISIHGGDTVQHASAHYRVPKRDLVGVLQVLLQQQRLRIARSLPEAATLVQELLNFRVTIDPRTAHDSYAAWREGQHDDLVLATALACWWGETHPPVPLAWPGGSTQRSQWR